LDDKLPRAAALLPWTSTLDDAVNGMRTSQMPMSSSCGLRSSAKGYATKFISPLKRQGTTETPTTQRQDGNTSRHFALNDQWRR
jgi:hypothetical protein